MNIIPLRIQGIIKRKWYAICCFFRPRQRWLTKVIPNEWTDKDHLIEQTLFACIIHFWDVEKAFGFTGGECCRYQWEMYDLEEGNRHFDGWEEARDKNKKIYDELYAAYNFAKALPTYRQELEDVVEEIYMPVVCKPQSVLMRDKELVFRKVEQPDFVQKLWEWELALTNEATRHLTSIVTYREHLWT